MAVKASRNLRYQARPQVTLSAVAMMMTALALVCDKAKQLYGYYHTQPNNLIGPQQCLLALK